jgi:hypothetical protein
MFTLDRKQPDGLYRTCRICNAEPIRRKKARCVASRCAGKQRRYEALRRTVLERYSNGVFRCACCGESRFEFLTLDHVNNDGKHHRRQCGSGRR